MSDSENQMFTVGELARRCGVTVRTLQYYDSEGILSPRHYTEGGRRLYAKEDLLVLQQILFLKSFGFPLDEIRDRLLKAQSPAEISRMFVQQKQVLEEQAEKLHEVIGLLSSLSEETERMGYLDAESLVVLMELMKLRSPYSFVFRYFGKKEMEVISTLMLNDDEDGFGADWQRMFTELTALYQRDADPEGPEGQALAAQWWAKVQEFTRGDGDVMSTLIHMGDDVDNWPDDVGEMKQATQTFLSKALAKYLVEHGMMPKGEERNE